jgi:hypothetical protein
MSDIKKSKTGGMLVRGVDGDVYFIPDEAMNQFKLPQKLNEEAKKLYEQENIHSVLFGRLKGTLVRDKLGAVSDDDATVICTNTLALRKLSSSDL